MIRNIHPIFRLTISNDCLNRRQRMKKCVHQRLPTGRSLNKPAVQREQEFIKSINLSSKLLTILTGTFQSSKTPCVNNMNKCQYLSFLNYEHELLLIGRTKQRTCLHNNTSLGDLVENVYKSNAQKDSC